MGNSYDPNRQITELIRVGNRKTYNTRSNLISRARPVEFPTIPPPANLVKPNAKHIVTIRPARVGNPYIGKIDTAKIEWRRYAPSLMDFPTLRPSRPSNIR